MNAKESMLWLISMLMEQGKEAGAEHDDAYKALVELKEGLINKVEFKSLSMEAQAALEAIVMLVLSK